MRLVNGLNEGTDALHIWHGVDPPTPLPERHGRGLHGQIGMVGVVAYGGGENFGTGEFCGENVAVKKSGKIRRPPANFSRRVTNKLTANSDAGEY